LLSFENIDHTLSVSTIKLDGVLVKEVSRSFYLTLRMLPQSVRGIISLGYLLARISDTIADTSSLGIKERIICLEKFKEDFSSQKASPQLLELVSTQFSNQPHEGERILMTQISVIIEATKSFSKEEQTYLRKVIRTIISGQKWDLEFFRGDLTQVKTEAELDQYTYKVAGCVGEFWTEILFLQELVRNTKKEEMLRLGINYGKGLQLTNIIRDIPEDFQNGRIYIPRVPPNLPEIVTGAKPWQNKAAHFLNDGIKYSKETPKGKLRAATILPAKLGLKTLALLEATPIEERVSSKVKIPRSMVFKQLILSFTA